MNKHTPKQVEKLVICGGPGVGKTSCLDRLKTKLHENDEVDVIFIDEVASIFLKDRTEHMKKLIPGDRVAFQFTVYRTQKFVEEMISHAIAGSEKRTVIILDRGFVDIFCYLDPEVIKEKVGIEDPSELVEAYDHVILLEGGQRREHSLENRIESYEEAEYYQEKSLGIWKSFYPDASVVPFFDSVDEKADHLARMINDIVQADVFTVGRE